MVQARSDATDLLVERVVGHVEDAKGRVGAAGRPVHRPVRVHDCVDVCDIFLDQATGAAQRYSQFAAMCSTTRAFVLQNNGL